MPRGACRDRSPRSHRAQPHRGRSRSSRYLIWAVLSPKRAPEETTPANLTPFLPDDELESRRLERVQGWALLFAAVVAVALPLYWLHEPTPAERSRPTTSTTNAAERGEVLFSNPSMPTYDPTQSLQCANCHGAKGQGGQVADPGQRQAGDLAGAAAQHGARCASRKTPSARTRRRPARRHRVQRHRRSSPTAGPARRCRRGASPAAARRTTSRSRTSSRSCARSS